jgi:hypothetical protein
MWKTFEGQILDCCTGWKGSMGPSIVMLQQNICTQKSASFGLDCRTQMIVYISIRCTVHSVPPGSVLFQDYPSFLLKEAQHNLSRRLSSSWSGTQVPDQGRGESVTEVVPFMNFLVHSHTCCSDRHASSYWTFNFRQFRLVSPLHYLKTDDRTLFFVGACCKRGRHIYTTTASSCFIPASYYHMSVTLHTMSITVVNLQDNRAVFQIFIALFKVSIWLSLVLKQTRSSIGRA